MKLAIVLAGSVAILLVVVLSHLRSVRIAAVIDPVNELVFWCALAMVAVIVFCGVIL